MAIAAGSDVVTGTDQVVGQDRVVAALRGAVARDRLAHGLMFIGPDGVGREKTARALARGLLCELRGTPAAVIPFGCGRCRACRRADSGAHPDLHVVMSEAEGVTRGLREPDGRARPSVEIKIDAVRELGLRLLRRPYEGKASVAIIVDAHQMNEKAQNALLKVLEEPAPTTVLILLVPGVRAVLPTIGSRCLRLAFSPLTEDVLRRVLRTLAVPDADARAARARDGVTSVPAALDDGGGTTAEAVSALTLALTHKQADTELGLRLRTAEGMGKDKLEVDAALKATMQALATSLRQSGGDVVVPGGLDAVGALDALWQAREDLAGNGAVQLVLERLLCGAAPSVLEAERRRR